MGTSEGSCKANWGQNFITPDFSGFLSKTQNGESSFSFQRAFCEYYIFSQENSGFNNNSDKDVFWLLIIQDTIFLGDLPWLFPSGLSKNIPYFAWVFRVKPWADNICRRYMGFQMLIFFGWTLYNQCKLDYFSALAMSALFSKSNAVFTRLL